MDPTTSQLNDCFKETLVLSDNVFDMSLHISPGPEPISSTIFVS